MMFPSLPLLMRFAGIRRVLGVDLTDKGVRVVELRRRRRGRSGKAGGYRATKAFPVEFSDDMDLESKAAALREALRGHGVKSVVACSCVNTIGVKTSQAHIPSDHEDVPEWVREHQEEILGLPFPLQEMLFRFEMLAEDDRGPNIEVTFVRRADVQAVVDFFSRTGLPLLALGAGVRDALVAASVLLAPGSDFTLMYACRSTVTAFPVRRGERGPRYLVPWNRQSATPFWDAGVRAPMHSTVPKVIVAGELAPGESAPESAALMPFGLPPEYTLAVGLALKGFLPQRSPVNFLEDPEQAPVMRLVQQGIVHRLLMVLTALLGALLLLPTGAAWLLESRREALRRESLVAASLLDEVVVLERNVGLLEQAVRAPIAVATITASSLVDGIGEAAADSVWFTALCVERNWKGGTSVRVSGWTTSHDSLAAFMNRLGSLQPSARVFLERSENFPDRPLLSDAHARTRNALGFEIRIMSAEQ